MARALEILPLLATGALLAAAIVLAVVGVRCWRRGRPAVALAAGAFAGFSGLTAAAVPLAQQVDQLVARAQVRAQAESGSARQLLESTRDRHERQLEAARALARRAPDHLAQGFAGLAEAGLVDSGATLAPDAATGPGVVYVAVSFSMPPADLRRLGRDAEQAGAIVVIQGLVRGSFKETVAAARQVFDESTLGGVAIDPNVFRAFAITAVPTFISAAAPVQPCARGLECTPEAPAHDRVAGNVPLAAALRILSGGDQAAEVAATAAERLRP